MAATLTEPLTIKVFFTKDLPAPHNTTELYLRDLLNEYALQNKSKFKVRFYNVSAETEGLNDAARENQQMAREYGIHWSRATQHIRAILAPPATAVVLGVKPRAALLYIERVSYDEQNTPLEFLRIRYRGDRYVLYNELTG
jgi:DNA-binding GntR family transcriptional regulator